MDKISIIVPIYNVEKYLDECLNSIVNQSYTNLEIVLVDDGSPDNCPKMCDEWAKKDNRIIVIHKENGGLSDARNAGLNAITGDYFVFVDSDDFVHKDYIKILKDGIDKYNADICIASHIRFLNSVTQEEIDSNYELHDSLQAYFRLANWHKDYVVAWSKMYKTNIFRDLQFKKGKINEDEFYITEVYYKTDKIVYTPAKIYFYRENPNSITGKSFTPKNINSLESLEFRDDFFVKNNFTQFLRNNRMSLLFLNATLYFDAKNAGYKKEAKELRKNYKKWYKVDKSKFPKKDKQRFWLFRYFPWLYALLYELNRRRKCKKK